MGLREDFESQGNFLFRRRGYLPLFLIPLVLLALHDSEWLERLAGDGVEDVYEWLCVGLSFFGLAIRCLTVGFAPDGTSGRNTHGQEAQSLNTKGMYSIVRHPLYLGNSLIFFGVLLFIETWWLIIIGIFLLFIHYERVAFAEEEFLRRKFGNAYTQWASSTPAFVPRPSKWIKPDRPFSLAKVIRKEYTGFFEIILTYTILDLLSDVITERKLEFDLHWMILFLIGLATYITVRVIKKKTKLLDRLKA